ncbi:MAG: spinster family MFS transporter [Terriglobales bacterium]
MGTRVHPRATLGVLTGLNFLNMIDRYVLFAVLPLVRAESGFQRSDTLYGLLTTAFFICYMLSAPVFGYFADRYSRRPLIIAGALIWSVATLLTAVTYDFRALFIRHAIVGVGEASFVTIAPGYIADLFAENKLARMLAIFYTAMAVGPAAGYAIGGILGASHGWRMPFYVVSGPGILLALGMFFLPEPKRGATDTVADSFERASIRGLARNGAFLTATLGMAMYTFALGGLSAWMPTFLSQERGISLMDANLLLGAMLIAGVVSTLVGGNVADRLLKRTAAAYYLVSGLALVVATPLMVLAIFTHGTLMLVAMCAAIVAIFFNNGPLNAAVVDSVSPRIRATAIAVNLFLIHMLGDEPSPPLIGYISTRTHSLQTGFIPTIVAVAVAAGILFYGKRFAPRFKAEPAETEAAVPSR